MKCFSIDSKYERSRFSVIAEILSSFLFWCSGRAEFSNWKVRLSSRKTVLTCSLLPSITCVSVTYTVSSPTESALTILYAVLLLKMTYLIILAARASSISSMASSQSQLKFFNKKCFKLSGFCPSFLFFIFSTLYSNLFSLSLFKSDIISLLTLLWPFNTKSEMLMNLIQNLKC